MSAVALPPGISLVNQQTFKRIRKVAQKRFPKTWERLVGLAWLVRLNTTRSLEPSFLRQARQVGSARKLPVPGPRQKKVLFFQTRSNPPHLAWAGTMAAALEVRGHVTKFLGCSRELATSCNNFNYPEGLSVSVCRTCHHYTRRYFDASGFDTTWLGEYGSAAERRRATATIDALDPAQYTHFEYAGIPLGHLVRHSVGHFLRTGSIGSDPVALDMYRKFLINGILVTDACNKLLDDWNPDIIVMLGGLFMPEHVMMSLAHKRNKRVVVYEIAMLAHDALMIQHDRPTDYDDRESWERYRHRPLTAEENRTLNEYLLQRTSGQRSVVNYWEQKEEDERKIRDMLRIDSTKPTAVLFPNITWDSALFEKEIAFHGMFEWIDATIRYFIDHPEYQLIVRAHPAESILPGSMRESVAGWVEQHFPKLPSNIIVVPSTNPVSSYKLMDMAQAGLVYASSTAMELGVRGVPTIVAGEVHFRRKGFTIDAMDPPSYLRALDDVMAGKHPKAEDIREIARRYAYFAFFRTSMPFGVVHCGEGEHPVLTYETPADLAPGKDRSLDIICDGIITGSPFLYE